jgi:hypothetical protein
MSGLHTIGILPPNGRRQIEITAHCMSTFFDVYLRGILLRNSRTGRDIQRLKTPVEQYSFAATRR